MRYDLLDFPFPPTHALGRVAPVSKHSEADTPDQWSIVMGGGVTRRSPRRPHETGTDTKSAHV
jgi:hypothetical protein